LGHLLPAELADVGAGLVAAEVAVVGGPELDLTLAGDAHPLEQALVWLEFGHIPRSLFPEISRISPGPPEKPLLFSTIRRGHCTSPWLVGKLGGGETSDTGGEIV